MEKIVERVMRSTRTPPASGVTHSELRIKVGNYVNLLTSAGKRDPDELTDLGIAYVHNIIDGPDPRYTGC